MWRLLEDRRCWDDVQSGWGSATPPPVPSVWLRPTGGLTQSIIGPHGEDFPVIRHPDEPAVAVCLETDERFEIPPEDEVILEFDLCAAAAGLATGLGLFDPREILHPRLWRLGDWIPVEGERFPVFLSLPTSLSEFVTHAGRGAAESARPFLFLSGTNRWHTSQARSVLQGHRAATAGVEDLVRVDSSGKVGLVRPLEDWFASFLAAHAPVAAGQPVPGRFPTPPGAKWSDIRMRAVDGHIFHVEVGGVSRRMTYQDMGLEDRRSRTPDQRFELLRKFAESGGKLQAPSPASERTRKTKQRLAEQLQALFGLTDSPFESREAGAGWRVRFQIEAER